MDLIIGRLIYWKIEIGWWKSNDSDVECWLSQIWGSRMEFKTRLTGFFET